MVDATRSRLARAHMAQPDPSGPQRIFSPRHLVSAPGMFRAMVRQGIRALPPEDKQQLVEAQVKATRPIISGLLASSAAILAITGLLQALHLTPGIGYPWWVVEGAALAIAGCAAGAWRLESWPPRLLLTLLGTLLFGVFISIPLPTAGGQVAIRTALFQLLPIALLALLARPVSVGSMIALMLGLAWLRVALHGDLASGPSLYWLYTFVTIGFGLLLGGYRTEYAVVALGIRQHLRTQANTDPLTGLPNRAGWNRDAVLAYTDAVTRASPLSLAFFDIDHFKQVNDTWGHAVGDAVLQSLGRILRERLDGNSHAARLGGEEFAVLFVGQDAAAAEGFVQRVRRNFEQVAADYRATVSAGVAHRQPAEAMAQHLRRADEALYEAKAAGRDRMVVSRA
jgi:diguanylate cyclase (GGDEF)-like protein